MDDVKTFETNFNNNYINEIRNLIKNGPLSGCRIRIMPGARIGGGLFKGFSIHMSDQIVPCLAGRDIGCGILTAELGNRKIDFNKLDRVVCKKFFGRKNHSVFDPTHLEAVNRLRGLKGIKYTSNINKYIGKLYYGDHFVELDEDEYGNKYLIIHTGSGNIGNMVSRHYLRIAEQSAERDIEIPGTYSNIRCKRKERVTAQKKYNLLSNTNEISQNSTNKEPYNLFCLNEDYRSVYINDISICQWYAAFNREVIIRGILSEYFGCQSSSDKINSILKQSFDTIHSYIDFNSNIIRNGAVSAKKGQRVLIPVSATEGCIIATGRGNYDWNESAPHGAGRIIGRSESIKSNISTASGQVIMGIYTKQMLKPGTSQPHFMYKGIEGIANKISDTVQINKMIKPIYIFRAQY